MAAVGIGPNVARATGATPFPLGTWHHIAFSADGAQLRLYVDGAQVAVVDYLADINPPDIPYLSMGARLNLNTNVNPPLLGIDASNPNTLFGQLDEVALWTRALSATEVQLLYEAGRNGQPLTSVVVPEPGGGEPGTLRISLNGANITVSWDKGTLQTAPTVTGPWTDVQGTSPLTEPTSGAAKFYRTVSQ
jgi:hypothetical protein